MTEVKAWRADKGKLGPKLMRILNAVKTSFNINLEDKDPPAKSKRRKKQSKVDRFNELTLATSPRITHLRDGIDAHSNLYIHQRNQPTNDTDSVSSADSDTTELSMSEVSDTEIPYFSDDEESLATVQVAHTSDANVVDPRLLPSKTRDIEFRDKHAQSLPMFRDETNRLLKPRLPIHKDLKKTTPISPTPRTTNPLAKRQPNLVTPVRPKKVHPASSIPHRKLSPVKQTKYRTQVRDDERPHLHLSIKKADREKWLTKQPTRTQALVEQQFGKENRKQCFQTEGVLRLILLPLWKSNFLDDRDWYCLMVASAWAFRLNQLSVEFQDVPMTNIRGYRYDDFESDAQIDEDRVRRVTRMLLHLDGCAASLVRYMGGSHVGGHRKADDVLQNLKPKLDPQLYDDFERVLKQGIPRKCNKSGSDQNFRAFRQYGNHSTVDLDPAKTHKALLKDYKRGYVIVVDERVLDFVLNCHVTPQGMVDVDDPCGRNPRNIFDSSFRPFPWCHSINDWTNKYTEKAVLCAHAEMEILQWIYNLRITYSDQEILIGDDDVSGAFRWLKYHPNLVAMHASVQSGYGVLNTGGTFGDNTTPSNWDCYAARFASSLTLEWSMTTKQSLSFFTASHCGVNMSEIRRFQKLFSMNSSRAISSRTEEEEECRLAEGPRVTASSDCGVFLLQGPW